LVGASPRIDLYLTGMEGVTPRVKNELNDIQETSNLAENLKQAFYQAYKEAYNEVN
jgi:flagellin-specific chaperone FliS